MFVFVFFFFNDTATTEIYTLSLHDALPILYGGLPMTVVPCAAISRKRDVPKRSEEHTSELQSLAYLVCRLLLEKKKLKNTPACMTHMVTQPSLLLVSSPTWHYAPSYSVRDP